MYRVLFSRIVQVVNCGILLKVVFSFMLLIKSIY